MNLAQIERYYKEIAKIRITSQNEKEWHAFCLFHDDKKRSLSVNKETGFWNCEGACAKGGNIVQFHARLKKISLKEAEEELKEIFGTNYVPNEEVEAMHKVLLKNGSIIEFLKKKRKINLSSVQRWKLGWDGERIWIPIKEGNLYVNVRRYDYTGKLSNKVVSYDAGYGETRLWPMENMDKEQILLCEGEMDCILANQFGYNAVTVTGGATTFQNRFIPFFKGKKVDICYDLDEAGEEGARKVAVKIFPVATEIRLIHLPSSLGIGGDFTDFIVTGGNTKRSFDTLLQQAELFGGFVKTKEIGEGITECTLADASSEEYFFRRIRMKAIVAGKDLCPYFSPRKVKLSCPASMKKCNICPLGIAEGKLMIEFKNTDPTIVKMIRCSEDQQKSIIKERLSLPKCTNIEIVIQSVWNIEQLRAIPEIEYSAKESEFIAREIFSIGQGVITNRSYSLEGVTVPDPKTQYSTQIINRIIPSQTSIDMFQMTREILKCLKIFQP